MFSGMTAAKIAISLPAGTLARAKKAVRANEAPTLSAFIATAIDEKVDGDDLRRMLAELLAETGGPPTASERAKARAELGLSRRARRR